INPRTVYDSPLGNPRKLERELSAKGLFALYHQGRVLGYRDIPLHTWLAYLLFDYLPALLVFEAPEDPYALVRNEECLPLASDMPILLSLWNLDFPSYSQILGSRKNLFYADLCEDSQQHELIPYVGNGEPQVYAYSSRGFHFPGQSLRLPAYLSVDLFEKRVLVFLYRGQELYKVFDQRSVREKLEEEGSYHLRVYTYRYKLWRFHFGLRFLLCTQPFYAM
ncbi:MAG: hypothetical protein N3C13_07060, partial [Aquificaceae bacterium]|nr:hypothetical protein [Aquificaceae bacterium]